MAKQIFISDEAYKILLAYKGEYDSFSNVIVRKFKKSGNAKDIIDRIKKNPLDKSYFIDKKLLREGWKQWEKSLTK